MFDLDGTLIDTERLYRAAFHAAARESVVVVPADLYAMLVGLATSDRRPVLRRVFGSGFPSASSSPLTTFDGKHTCQRASPCAQVPRRGCGASTYQGGRDVWQPGTGRKVHTLSMPIWKEDR